MIGYPGPVYYCVTAFIRALGPRAHFFWLAAGAAWIIALAWIAWRQDRGGVPARLFPAVLAAGIVLLRLPTLALFEQNPDEGQWIAGAASLLRDPRIWLSVDGTTSGPLNLYPLTALGVFGGFNYAALRLFGILVCAIPALLIIRASLARLYARGPASIVIVPAAAAFALVDFWDLCAYSSEYIPMLLTAASLAAAAGYIRDPARRGSGLAAAIFAGCLPYAKLQALPIAAAIALALILFGPARRDQPRHSRLMVIGGFLAPSVVVAVYLICAGLSGDFIRQYVLSNILYSGEYSRIPVGSLVDRCTIPFVLMNRVLPAELCFRALAWTAVIAGLFAVRAKVSGSNRGIAGLALSAAAGAYIGIILPGNYFFHYLYLGLVPMTFLAGVFAGCAWDTAAGTLLRRALIVLCASCGLLIAAGASAREHRGISYVRALAARGDGFYRSPEAAAIMGHAAPGGRMAVWGWRNSLYVETGLTQGARQAHAYWQMAPGKLREYYRELFARDLKSNKPEVFVDAVGASGAFFYSGRGTGERHEAFPALNGIIAGAYSLLGDIGGVRIYLRNKE